MRAESGDRAGVSAHGARGVPARTVANCAAGFPAAARGGRVAGVAASSLSWLHDEELPTFAIGLKRGQQHWPSWTLDPGSGSGQEIRGGELSTGSYQHEATAGELRC